MSCESRFCVRQLLLMLVRTKVSAYWLPFTFCWRDLIDLKLLCFPGKHEFSWAVLPHRGHFLQSSVPIAAYLFNSPLHGVSTPFHHTTDPF